MTGEWFALLVLALGLGALCYSVMALWVEIKAMKNSTHTIQYMDPKIKFENMSEEVKSTLHKDPFEPIM